jgi:hypothetical protein
MTTAKGYSLDTNSLLMAWNETYRPTSFEGFWKRLDELIDAGRAFVCEDVKRELAKKDDNVHDWVKSRPHLVVPLEEEQLRRAKGLASKFPNLAKERLGRMRADGFVIALAQWKGYTVVTAENHRGADKIPNICQAQGVPCISLADMIQSEGWTF